jgi:hypothetical protein
MGFDGWWAGGYNDALAAGDWRSGGVAGPAPAVTGSISGIRLRRMPDGRGSYQAIQERTQSWREM